MYTGHIDGFELRLSNCQCWHLVSSGDTWPWLSEFAKIMRLKKAGQGPCAKIFFTQYDQNDPDYLKHIPAGLPDNGWTIRSFKPLLMLYHEGLPDIICNIGAELEGPLKYARMIGSYRPIYERLLTAGGAPLHAGLIVRDGSGILLIAPQGVGKSTCCNRIPPPWEAWSDDTALVARIGDGSYHAHPMPTLGNLVQDLEPVTWDVEAHVPVKAIFILEQSKSDQAVPVSSGEAALHIYEAVIRGCAYSLKEDIFKRRKEVMQPAFNNACDISRKIPSYRLRVSLEGSYWDEIDSVLSVV